MPTRCAVENCGLAVASHGFCGTHWKRLQRTGSADGRRTRACRVEGCGRPHRSGGYCRLHFERLRDERPLDMPVRTSRHERRSHHEALADLARRLVRLGVCQSAEEAIHLVGLLVSAWPRSVDPGLLGVAEPVHASELVELDAWPPSGSPCRGASQVERGLHRLEGKLGAWDAQVLLGRSRWRCRHWTTSSTGVLLADRAAELQRCLGGRVVIHDVKCDA